MHKLEAFLTADWEEQSRMLDDQNTAQEVKSWLGPTAFAELQQLGRTGSHLAGGKKNLIVVPGVMGSMLQSEGKGGIWWVDVLRARDKLNGLALAPGGLEDLDADASIAACAIDVTYAPMRAAIAQSGQFGGSIQFPYDWRKPLRTSAAALRDLICKVHSEYGEPVHLVGHSMGGLMIRTALMLHGTELWPKLGKIVFIATPHYGSTSIAGYLKNHLWGWDQLAVLGFFLSRHTFRSMWGILSLLPAPPLVYPGTRHSEAHPCANFDLYDANAYQLDLDAEATKALQSALDAARMFHIELFKWHSNDLSPAQRGQMLQITGVGRKTLFRLESHTKWLGLWKDVQKIVTRTPGDPNREGDGRVPQASADLEKVELRYVRGEHGAMQNLPAVVAEVLAWIADQPLSLATSPQEALSGHLSNSITSSAPHLDGSADFNPHDDDYDRYRDLTDDQMRALVAQLEAGNLGGVNLARIL